MFSIEAVADIICSALPSLVYLFLELLMSRNSVAVTGVTVLLGLTLACTSKSSTPLTPTTPGESAGAASDGSTLKVTAPVPQSPVGGVKPSTGPATLVVSAATAAFTGTPALQYRFQVFNSANALVQDSGPLNSTSYQPADLTTDATYSWQARAEYQGSVGPWSAKASFIAPVSGGYILGNELYDPLNNGKTVGEIHGPVTFIPGVGVRLDAEESYIQYTLPQTLVEGEYSVLASGMGVVSSTEDPKLRIITMREGDASINDNIYRMSVEIGRASCRESV